MATDSGSRIDRYTLHGKMTYMRSTALMPIAVTILHLAATPAHARVVHIAVDHNGTRLYRDLAYNPFSNDRDPNGDPVGRVVLSIRVQYELPFPPTHRFERRKRPERLLDERLDRCDIPGFGLSDCHVHAAGVPVRL